jgi:hypothetical protein
MTKRMTRAMRRRMSDLISASYDAQQASGLAACPPWAEQVTVAAVRRDCRCHLCLGLCGSPMHDRGISTRGG